MDSRHRTGTVTCSAERVRQSSSRYARASRLDTTGAVGVLNVTEARSAGSASAASRINGVWNAPPTFNGVTRLTPISLARSEPAATPSGVPAITTCPGALSLATQHASGAAEHA